MEDFIRKGELRYLYKSKNDIGKTNGSTIVVLSSIMINDVCERVIVAPLAGAEIRMLPSHMYVKSGRINGYVIPERMHDVLKENLGPCEGMISDKDINELDKRLDLTFERGAKLNSEFLKKIEKEYRKNEKRDDIERQKEIVRQVKEETSELSRELENKEKKISEQLEALAKSSAETKQLNSQIEKLQQELCERDAQISKNAEKYKNILESYEEKIDVLDKQMREKTRSMESIERSGKEKAKAYSDKDRQIAQMKEKLDKNEKELEETKYNIEIKDRKIEDYRNKVTELDDKISSMRKHIDELQAKQIATVPDSDVELEVVTMERDMYRSKYMEILREKK
jgi:myosin-like protein